jgi:hypothetical protein
MSTTTANLHKRMKYAMPNSMHVYLMYAMTRRTLPRLWHPRSFSEKIQWLKMHGNLEQFTSYADKYEVRDFVKKMAGEDCLIPLIGVWDSFDEIPFNDLPNQFVMKGTHGSGYNIIVKDKKTVDREEMRQKMTNWLTQNYYHVSRETQYKNAKPRIVVEQYIEGENGDLKDYKFYFFNGKPEIILVMTERQKGLKIDVFDMNWKQLPVIVGNYPNSKKPPQKPKQFNELLELATKLSTSFPMVRTDLYTANNKVYFGELTFTPSSGLERFGDKTFDRWLGDRIDLKSYRHKIA